MFLNKENIEDLFKSLQQCRISLLETGELMVVPASARCGDIVCILSGSNAPCLLRPNQDGNWTLISGDCYIFSDFTFPDHPGVFMCDEFVAHNQDSVQEFIIQ